MMVFGVSSVIKEWGDLSAKQNAYQKKTTLK